MLRIAEKAIGGDACELHLDGELDLWTAERLQGTLHRVGSAYKTILVGLDDCDFVDSTGIALFLQARRQLEAEGGQLILYGGSEQVLRTFTVAGLTDEGLIFASRGDALAELARSANPR
jgi:anti-sigma B factor antagonist